MKCYYDEVVLARSCTICASCIRTSQIQGNHGNLCDGTSESKLFPLHHATGTAALVVAIATGSSVALSSPPLSLPPSPPSPSSSSLHLLPLPPSPSPPPPPPSPPNLLSQAPGHSPAMRGTLPPISSPPGHMREGGGGGVECECWL